jgi:hypothetical protein
LFEFVINDSSLLVSTKLVIIPLCLVKDQKLYTESETWSFHTPLADEILEREFGFYEFFDDLCFFFPKSFIDPKKISEQLNGPGLSIAKKGDSSAKAIIPSELDFSTPVDSLV